MLAAHPLPDHHSGQDKHDRGTVLVVGGSVETPGAVLLAGIAALRAGAGRLRIALAALDGAALAVAVPEARVMAIGEAGSGTGASGRSALVEAVRSANAVVVGSGAAPEVAGVLLELAVEAMADTASCLVVDAAAFDALGEDVAMLRHRAARTLLIPNSAEAANLIGVDPAALSVAELAERVGNRTGCAVVVRGPQTYVRDPRDPQGSSFVERSGPVGLATSGSGDVFAGLVTGYLARGAGPLSAALWAARVHARAGSCAAEHHGPVHFLARDLVDLLPEAHRAVAAEEPEASGVGRRRGGVEDRPARSDA